MNRFKSDYLSELHLLINQYRGAINKANRAMRQYEASPSRELLVEQCEHYKTAADLCGQIALRYPRKEDRDEWLENQAEADRQMQRIYDIATGRVPPKAPDYFDSMRRPGYDPAPARSAAAPDYQRTAAAAQPVQPAQPADQGNGEVGGNGYKRTGIKPTDGITEDVVEKWFRESPKHGFDKVSGMIDLVAKLKGHVSDMAAARFKELMGVSNTHSFFLYGPPGCGKTYIIEAFIHELMKQGYCFMKLAGADIHASLVGEAEKRVERAFAEARRHAPCILFIDEIDSVCRNRSTPNLPNHALNTTNAFLNAYNEMVSDDKPVIFIGATNYPHMVDVAMADRAEMVRVPLPDLPAKANKFRMLFEKKVKNEDGTTTTQTKIALEPGLTYTDLADEIDNYSYRDFDRLQKSLVDALLSELRSSYGQGAEAGEEMYRAVSTGEHPLTRALFMKVLESFQPSKKDEIIRSLDSWDADIQKKMNG